MDAMKAKQFCKIVDDESAVMKVAGERVVPMPGCNHRNICRFKKANSNAYKIILGHLEELADEANASKSNLV